MWKKHRGKIVLGALALVVLFFVVSALRPKPLEVDAAAVTRGPLRVTVDEDGVTRVQDRYVITAPVAGRVGRIALKEGDVVRAGQVVARMASAPLDVRSGMQSTAAVSAAQAAVAQADARVSEARAALEQARREARRARTLAEAGALSEQAREQADLAAVSRQRELEAAQAASRAAQADVRAARAALVDASPSGPASSATEVRSPVRGRVLRVARQSEGTVAPGEPLVELGDAAALEVVVDVLSTDAVRVQPGMPLLIEEWGGGQTLRGRVRTVSPGAFTKVSALGVEEQRVNVIGDLVDAPGPLGDGYRVEARIVTWEGDRVLKAPVSALFRAGDDWSVFVIQDGRARLRKVRVGHRGDAEAEILSGLREGEPVIVFPSDQVADGVLVKPRDA